MLLQRSLRIWLWVSLVFVATLAGCGGGADEDLPPPPAPSVPRAIGCGGQFFVDANFSGPNLVSFFSEADLSAVVGPCAGGNFNDCISSIRVNPGCPPVEVFVDVNFSGASAAFTSDVADLALIPGPCAGGNFNNCISSFIVIGAIPQLP